jgi:FkbM family methyltransferase
VSFDRANPSPRYLELQALYQRMHREGEKRLGIPAEKMFPGNSLLPHAARIRQLVEMTGARTILDYGAGKGLQYRPQSVIVDGRHVADGVAEYWDVDEVRCFDPGYAPHASLPEGQFDGVISTDVLEHCPQEDLAWIIDEILGYARTFVYLNVACFSAKKSLPTGENAHVTVREPEWWRRLLSERAKSFPALRWELRAAHLADGAIREAIYSSGGTDGAVPSGAVALVDIEGKVAKFHTPNEMTRWRVETLYTKEPATIDWLRAMRQGAVFVDVGANVGMYTVFAAVARDARVFAFEPESENYAVLNGNLRLNGLSGRVLAMCAGLSDHASIAPLYLSKAGAGGSCHSLGAEVGFDLAPRPAGFVQGSVALRLDDLISSGQMPVPEYVKIDVDGFEHKVIRGMEETLRNARARSLIVELNPRLSEHREIREHLRSMGFRCDAAQVEAATRKSGPFEGVAEHVFRR